MILKFIDNEGCTHYLEAREIAFRGRGGSGQAHAAGFDGFECVVNYGSVVNDERSHVQSLWFTMTRKDGTRLAMGGYMQAAWLMNDDGKTVDTLHLLDEPVEVQLGADMMPEPLPT